MFRKDQLPLKYMNNKMLLIRTGISQDISLRQNMRIDCQTLKLMREILLFHVLEQLEKYMNCRKILSREL